MTQEELRKKAEEYLKTVRERSIEPDMDTVADYIAGYKQCEDDYKKWREESINNQQDY